jgi:hypothetical protein
MPFHNPLHVMKPCCYALQYSRKADKRIKIGSDAILHNIYIHLFYSSLYLIEIARDFTVEKINHSI